MRLKTIREDLAYFTLATGERTRNLAYGGIAAAWIVNSSGSKLAPLLLISIILFSAFFVLDVFGAIYCADKARQIILDQEDKVYRLTGKLPDENHEFDYYPNSNTLSEQVSVLRPWIAGVGYVPLAIHLIRNAGS